MRNLSLLSTVGASCASLLLLAASSFGVADAAAELKLEVYDGPTECGDDDKVRDGRYLKMHYTGKIDESSEAGEKGKQFDSSRGRDRTFDFQIGQGAVIKGWDEGLIGLCKGAKAKVVIPPDMGYGSSGAGPDIPGGATLQFDVEVVDVSDEAPPPPPVANVFADIDTDGDARLTKEEVDGWFEKQGRTVPDALWENEDKDEDGIITWEEFGGPKGDEPPKGKDAMKEEL